MAGGGRFAGAYMLCVTAVIAGSFSSCVTVTAAGSDQGQGMIHQNASQEFEKLRTVTNVRVFLVPKYSSFLTAVTRDNVEGVACAYRSNVPAAITALVDQLSTSVAGSAIRDSLSPFEVRIGILFYKEDKVIAKAYFADMPMQGRAKVPGEFSGRALESDATIRGRLEEWVRRPDVEGLGNPSYTPSENLRCNEK